MSKPSLPAWAQQLDSLDIGARRQSVRHKVGRPRPQRLICRTSPCPEGGSVVAPRLGVGNPRGASRMAVSVPQSLRADLDQVALGAGHSTALVALATWAIGELRERKLRLTVTGD